MVILLMGLKMFRKIDDPITEQSNLYLRRARIAIVALKLIDYGPFVALTLLHDSSFLKGLPMALRTTFCLLPLKFSPPSTNATTLWGKLQRSISDVYDPSRCPTKISGTLLCFNNCYQSSTIIKGPVSCP